MNPLPHPAWVCSGPQLDRIISELEAKTYYPPGEVVLRDDLDAVTAARLARATGADAAQVSGLLAKIGRHM